MKKMTKLVAVAIPIFKCTLNAYEEISLIQCLKVLHRYPIVFFAPKLLEINKYLIYLQNHPNTVIIRFPDKYFVSLEAYNELLLCQDFYKRFSNYLYILIYHLDSFVFNDELMYWCSKGYDYIGAPWFDGWEKCDEQSNILPYGGNGGFSLRRIGAHLKVLKSNNNRCINGFHEIKQNYLDRSIFGKMQLLPSLITKYTGYPNTAYYFQRLHRNEDGLWVQVASEIDYGFKVAEPNIAIPFAFECQPRRLYKIIQKLPFGCHGWERFDIEFWRPFFHTYGFKI